MEKEFYSQLVESGGTCSCNGELSRVLLEGKTNDKRKISFTNAVTRARTVPHDYLPSSFSKMHATFACRNQSPLATFRLAISLATHTIWLALQTLDFPEMWTLRAKV